MDERDRRIAAMLFLVISSVYFATVAGITSSNDGSHYALVRALVDGRSFEISEYLSFTEFQDYALHGDLRFSDRPPGTALLSAPAYALSAFLPGPLSPIHSKHDTDNPRLIYAMVVPAAAASLTAVVLFWMLRANFGLSRWASVLTTAAFAFGTMTWKYGSLLYSHATSGLAVMAAVALMLRWGGREVGARAHFLLGALVGASVLMEYTNLIFVALAGAYWAWQSLVPSPQPSPAARPQGRENPHPYSAPSETRRQWRGLLAFAIGGMVPAAFLMWYNTVNFGGPLEFSTFNVDTTRWPQNESFLTDFATPLWVGLPAMLFYGHSNQGLFWLAPVALLGLAGLSALWRTSRRRFALIVGGFAAMLLLFSTSTTFNPYTNDGRYLTPFLGLWFVAAGFGMSRILTWGSSPHQGEGRGVRGEAIRLAIVYALLFLSVRNQVMHIAFSWGHDLDPASLLPLSVAPENIAALWAAVLPNALNLPLWWGMVAAGWVVWRLARSGRRRQGQG